MSLVIPPNTRAVGTPDPAGDMDNVADVLGLLTQALAGVAGKPGNTPPAGNAANIAAVQTLIFGTGADTGLQPSGDTTGAADTANINNALGGVAGAVATLGDGTFYLKSDILLNASGQKLRGAGISSTIISPVNSGASFTSAMIHITGNGCEVSGIQFLGLTGGTASNTAVTAILDSNVDVRLSNMFFKYINGWCIDHEQSGSGAGGVLFSTIRAQNCAGGIKLYGNGTVGANLIDCGTAQIGVATGAFANLDALLMLGPTFDVTGVNCNFSVSNATTGHAFHLLGHVSEVWFSIIDSGGFPFPAAGSGQCGVMIEDDASGHASSIHFSHGVFQTYDIGVYVKGPGAFDWHFDDCQIHNNMTHGARVDSTFGNPGGFTNCGFGSPAGNGQGGATSYAYTATNASPAVFTATGSAFVNGATVQLTSGAPTGFSTATTYFVVNVSGTTFNLSATSGGTAINSTSTGSGTLTPGPSYDLDWTSNATGAVTGNRFGTGIVAVGSAGVQSSVALPSGNSTYFGQNVFASASGNYTNRPKLQQGVALDAGTTALVAGTKTVSTATVTATTRIGLRMVAPGGTPGAVFVSAVTAATSFTITSTNAADTSTVEWAVYP